MTPYLTQRGGVYVAVYELHGKRCRTSTRTRDPAQAAAVLADLIAAGGPPPAAPSKGREPTGLIALIDQWAASKAARQCSPEYIRRAKASISRSIRFAKWGAVRQITGPAVFALREAMLAKGYPPGRVNQQFAYLRSFTTWLWRMGKLPADPMTDIGALRHDPARRRALTPDEIAALCKGAPDWAGRVYAALFYSGLRVDIELARLEWQHWGLDGVLRFRGKGGTHRTVPVSDALRGVLEAQRASQRLTINPSGLIFPRVPTPAEFNEHLKLAGIAKVDGRGHVATRHSLRHSWNQALTRAGVGGEVRAHLGGWSDDTMPTTQYQDARALDLRGAMDLIPRVA